MKPRLARPRGASRVSSWKPLAQTLGTLATLPLLWFFVARVLSADRGIEFTDEGLYLLEAVEGRGSTALQFPYAWHTGPLLDVVGGNVADFRTLGGVILAIVAAWAAVTGFRAGARITERSPASGSGRPLEVWIALTAASSALLFYGGLVRTPSYNWVNLVGLLIAVTGLHLRLTWQGRSRAHNMLPEGITALGLFLTVPARPTTPILFALIAFPLLWRLMGLRRAATVMLTIIAMSAAVLLLAVLTQFWDRAFFSVFLRTASAPSFTASQSVMGGVLGMIRTPIEALRTAPFVALGLAAIVLRVAPRGRLRPRTGVVLGGVVLAAAGTLWGFSERVVVRVHGGWPSSGIADLVLQGRASQPSNHYLAQVRFLIGILVLVVLLSLALLSMRSEERARPDLIRVWVPPVLSFAAAILLLDPRQSVLFGGQGVFRFADPGVAGALFMLVLTACLLQRRREEDQAHTHSALVVALVLLALAYGFGSGNYPFPQAALAAPLFVAAAGACAGAAQGQRRRLIVATAAALMAVTTGTVLIDSHHRPYRTANISDQTEWVVLAGTQLRVDPGTAAFLEGLQRDAASAGWTKGDLILDLSEAWVPGLTWVLEGRPPVTTLLTIGGHGQRSVARLEHSLSFVDPDDARKAWTFVSVDQDGRLHPGSAALVDPFLEHVSCATLRHCFESVWREPTAAETGLEFWRPIRQQ